MSDKKGKIIFFVLLAIVLIFALFFLFRITSHVSKTSPKDSLICTMSFNEKNKVTYETLFKNENVEKITITYLDENNNQGIEYTSLKTQIDYFCALEGSTFKYINNDLIITIDKEVLKKNKNDEVIKNMFKKYSSLKTYYEKLGYDCE